MKTKQLLLTLAFSMALVFVSLDSFAPPTAGGGPTSGGGAGCWPPPCIPIDGGIGLLMAAGIAIGGKKLLDMRTK